LGLAALALGFSTSSVACGKQKSSDRSIISAGQVRASQALNSKSFLKLCSNYRSNDRSPLLRFKATASSISISSVSSSFSSNNSSIRSFLRQAAASPEPLLCFPASPHHHHHTQLPTCTVTATIRTLLRSLKPTQPLRRKRRRSQRGQKKTFAHKSLYEAYKKCEDLPPLVGSCDTIPNFWVLQKKR
jgi:hypothetical protein